MTVSEVFPVGGESGAQASSLQSGSGWKSPVVGHQVRTAGMRCRRPTADTASIGKVTGRQSCYITRATVLDPETESSWGRRQSGNQRRRSQVAHGTYVEDGDASFRRLMKTAVFIGSDDASHWRTDDDTRISEDCGGTARVYMRAAG